MKMNSSSNGISKCNNDEIELSHIHSPPLDACIVAMVTLSCFEPSSCFDVSPEYRDTFYDVLNTIIQHNEMNGQKKSNNLRKLDLSLN